jgi:starch synthase (maltosyl-transferring)
MMGVPPYRLGTDCEKSDMQHRQTTSRASIYYMHPGFLNGGDEARHLDRCRAMGFAQVLIAPPFRPSRSGNALLTADFDTLDPRLGGRPGLASLQALSASCHRRGLELWIDLVLDRLAPDAPLVSAQPHWFSDGNHDPLPDPRIPGTVHRAAHWSFGTGADSEIANWWRGHIEQWLDAGIDGFRLENPRAVPKTMLGNLIAAAKAHNSACRFVAWTPGLPGYELNALRQLGLDFTVGSTCWWDFKDDWYVDEQAQLEEVAPPIALAEAPFGHRLAEQFGSGEELERGYRRAIDFAATAEHGWLMPMGFEFASSLPLEPTQVDPAAFERQLKSGNAPLADEIAAANARGAELAMMALRRWRVLSAPGATVLAEIDTATRKLRLTNALLTEFGIADLDALLMRGAGPWSLAVPEAQVKLQPGEVRLLDLVQLDPVKLAAPQSRRQALAAAKAPRVVVAHIGPQVEAGRAPVKRVVGEAVTVEADIFSDGHGELAADVLWRAADEAEWRRLPMRSMGNDRWSATFRPARIGDHFFTVEAWRDDFASLQHGAQMKRDAGQAIDLDASEMQRHLDDHLPPKAEREPALKALLAKLRRAKAAERTGLLLSAEARAAMRNAAPGASRIRHQPPIPLSVDRCAALFASWYELFPRSQSGSASRHGTFDDVIARLPAIAAMGFDVLYFPPIHPIGRINRKGRNNSTTAAPGEPGSPYAIGSTEGGHDAIHPELGTLSDFHRLRDAAAAHGMEIALDFAIQCAPDHPWLKEHPGWFAWRADGSIAYAENPPKKYEDIVNVDFYAEEAVPDLWIALRDVLLHWRKQGVATFRVDNPHTKPLPFWRWLIADIHARYPDTLFLSEAFTRPQMMYALAQAGFTQSYTYFTWRNTKREIETYMTELTQGAPKDFFRPNFFVNTPDINPFFLQRAGRAGFLIRAALATTLSGLWGVYSGFELCEGAPLPGREEYLDSEKYQIRAWDWNRPGNIVAEITALNRLRRRNPALQTHLGLRFLAAANDNITAFVKATPERDNVLLVAINLDPYHAQEALIELPLWAWGLPDDATIQVKDLIGGARLQWGGKYQRIRLDPYQLPYAIWRLDIPAGGVA